MHLQDDQLTKISDQVMVERRQQLRSPTTAQTIRKTRDQLSYVAGNPAFDNELLKVHINAVLNSARVGPLVLIAIALSGWLIGMRWSILAWCAYAFFAYGVLVAVANRANGALKDDQDARNLRRSLFIGHFVAGTSWVALLFVDCAQCVPNFLPVAYAAILLIVIGASAIITSSLLGSLVVTFTVPVAIYISYIADLSNVVQSTMALLTLISLPFFALISRQLNSSAKLLLSFRSEKDGLIGELETAKAHSDEARRRAEEANLAKSRFLASMSHELRTPLNAILGFSEMLATQALGPLENETYRDYAQDIHNSGSHLLHVINEILDLSRIEAGRYELRESAVLLSESADHSCRMLNLKAKQKNIQISTHYEADLPKIWADERAVRQVILNLLSNAVKFSPTDGEIHVLVGWTAGGGQYVAVKDNGPGIAQDEIPVVLSAFGQGAIAIKTAEQGSGLGLPIVQAIMGLHGGTLELESKLREGTQAIVIFPASRVMQNYTADFNARGRQLHAAR